MRNEVSLYINNEFRMSDRAEPYLNIQEDSKIKRTKILTDKLTKKRV